MKILKICLLPVKIPLIFFTTFVQDIYFTFNRPPIDWSENEVTCGISHKKQLM